MRSPLLLLALLLALPSAAAQEEDMLHILQYQYAPDPFEAAPGATVVVMNFGDPASPPEVQGEFVHSVTAVDGSFDLQGIEPNGRPYTFSAPTTPGAYVYYCRYHATPSGGPDGSPSGMHGTLVVSEAKAAPTPTPAPASSTDASTDSKDTPAASVLSVIVLASVALLSRRR